MYGMELDLSTTNVECAFAPAADYGIETITDLDSTPEFQKKVKTMNEIYEALAITKQMLDNYESHTRDALLSQFNIMKAEKSAIIAQMRIHDPALKRAINNTFHKCYEILCKYRLLTGVEKDTISVFDCAGLTGHTLYAMKYYTTVALGKKFDWLANADVTSEQQNDQAFRLLNKHPGRWVLDPRSPCQGRLSNVGNVDFICRSLAQRPMDFVFGDYAIDSSGHYDDQEGFFNPYVVGQIMVALHLLRRGGSFCFKQYLISKPFTYSYLYALSHMFDEMYIIKPASSKRQNSEIYIVCKGYRYIGRDCRCKVDPTCGETNNCGPMRAFYYILREAMEKKSFLPFIAPEVLLPFVKKVMAFLERLYFQQMQMIMDIDECVTGLGTKNPEVIRTKILQFIRSNQHMAEQLRTFRVTCGPYKPVRMEDFVV